jgi:hypothetical protein
VRSPSPLVFLGPFFVFGLEFCSAVGRASEIRSLVHFSLPLGILVFCSLVLCGSGRFSRAQVTHVPVSGSLTKEHTDRLCLLREGLISRSTCDFSFVSLMFYSAGLIPFLVFAFHLSLPLLKSRATDSCSRHRAQLMASSSISFVM